MADILYLGKKSAELRPKADNTMGEALGGADIIFFTGVRYERDGASPIDSADQIDSPVSAKRALSESKKCQQMQSPGANDGAD